MKEWRTEYEHDFIDIGLGYYIVKFASPEDRMAMLIGGPYKIFDHYLTVQPWEPSFQPARAKAPKIAVWIKLHGVLAMCYHESVVLYLARKLGNPIKVDRGTLLATRGKFARVCVEVDLSQRLPSTVDLDLEELPQSLILVEYKGLHRICFHCGEYGHKEEACRFKNPTPVKEDGGGVPKFTGVNGDCARAIVALSQTLKSETSENDMIYGPWMIAKRKPRKVNQPRSMMGTLYQESDERMERLEANEPRAQVDTNKKRKEIRGRNQGYRDMNTNRFAVISDVMEEDRELWGQGDHAGIVQTVSPNNPVEIQEQNTPTHVTLDLSIESHESHSQQIDLGPSVPVIATPEMVDGLSSQQSKVSPKKNRLKTLKPVSKISKTPSSKLAEVTPITKKQSSVTLEKQPPLPVPQVPVQTPTNLLPQAHCKNPQQPHSMGTLNCPELQQLASNQPTEPPDSRKVVLENVTLPPVHNVAATPSSIISR
ncbi:hypothetical protein SLE2022_029190 [Rubroshorea leprosula]